MATHYFLTNRYVDENDEIRNDGKETAQDDIRFGTLSFDPKKRKPQFDYELFSDPELTQKEVLMSSATGQISPKKKLGSEKMFEGLYKQVCKVKKPAEILFYIHGYNCTRDDSFHLVADLHREYVENPASPIKHIVLFTWPSRGQLLQYRDDAVDATVSGYVLGRAFQKLKTFFTRYFILEDHPRCEQPIHLMCHSMGNRVLEAMLQHLISHNISITSLFKEILLLAADVDYDSFDMNKPLYRVIDFGERVHVYYHNRDSALAISENSKNAFNRLGRWGIKNTVQLPDDVYQANVTGVTDKGGVKSKLVNHWYYLSSPEVVNDVIDVLQGKPSLFSDIFLEG